MWSTSDKIGAGLGGLALLGAVGIGVTVWARQRAPVVAAPTAPEHASSSSTGSAPLPAPQCDVLLEKLAKEAGGKREMNAGTAQAFLNGLYAQVESARLICASEGRPEDALWPKLEAAVDSMCSQTGLFAPGTKGGHRVCAAPELPAVGSADAAKECSKEWAKTEAAALLKEGQAMSTTRNAASDDLASAKSCSEAMRSLQPRAKALRKCAIEGMPMSDPAWTSLRIGAGFLESCTTCVRGVVSEPVSADWYCSEAAKQVKKLADQP